jgi:hypothetical protein
MTRSTAQGQSALFAVRFRECLLLFLLILSCARGLQAQGVSISNDSNVLTYHNDNARLGLNAGEKILSPSNVQWRQFGLLFVLPVDGFVYAEPLYVSGVVFSNNSVHDVLIVATENDSVYAFDAVKGTLLWQTSVLGAGETASDERNCNQITPQIGITSTPVIHASVGKHPSQRQGTVYVVAMSKDTSDNYHQRLHALDLATGTEVLGGPVGVQARYPGTGDNSQNGFVIFDPAQYKERSGLLRLNHVIYTAWASHCDVRPYTGWVIGYDENTLAQTKVLNITPNGDQGAVWQSGGGLAADGEGYIYFLAGNGIFDTTLDAHGFPSEGDFGNSFMKVSTTGSNLSVADYFTMSNTAVDSKDDIDFGSGGAMLLPNMTDAQGKTWQLAVGAGKDTNIYLVDRHNLGKFNSDSNNVYQEIEGVFSHELLGTPAYFNGTIYYGAFGDYLKAFQFSNARLPSTPTSRSPIGFGYPGLVPSVSANGTSNGIVWACAHGNPAVLYAFDATNLANELYNSDQAPNGRDQFADYCAKFNPPMISHGRVYMGTNSGVAVFGLLPSGHLASARKSRPSDSGEHAEKPSPTPAAVTSAPDNDRSYWGAQKK